MYNFGRLSAKLELMQRLGVGVGVEEGQELEVTFGEKGKALFGGEGDTIMKEEHKEEQQEDSKEEQMDTPEKVLVQHLISPMGVSKMQEEDESYRHVAKNLKIDVVNLMTGHFKREHNKQLDSCFEGLIVKSTGKLF